MYKGEAKNAQEYRNDKKNKGQFKGVNEFV